MLCANFVSKSKAGSTKTRPVYTDSSPTIMFIILPHGEKKKAPRKRSCEGVNTCRNFFHFRIANRDLPEEICGLWPVSGPTIGWKYSVVFVCMGMHGVVKG